MKQLRVSIAVMLLCAVLASLHPLPRSLQAAPADGWWDVAWPYRVPVTVGGSGVAQASLNFTTMFDALGLNGGLLDLRSIRVVPYYGSTPGAPIPYAETYSHLLHDAETATGWSTNDLGAVVLDASRFTQGSTSVHTVVTNTTGGYGYPGVEVYKGTVGGSVQPCYWDLVDALYEDFADHRLTPKGVGWPAGLNYPGGVEYDCNGNLDPVSWGVWGFHDLAQRYLRGDDLDNGTGFPSFSIKGPSSNWPPDSRPSSFCEESRGTDPPGDTAYNTKWFQYWGAVSSYLGANADYAAKGYYHIVNEPQTLEDYDIVAYLAQQTKLNAPNVRILLSEQVEAGIYDNSTYPGAKIDVWMPTISNYEVESSHDRQQNHDEAGWWYFLYDDRPPLPNPTVIDRTGIEARITPWLAWLERVEGLVYYSITDWNPDPWATPWLNDGNGDGFMLYPPKDSTIAYDACQAQSNRLAPSLR
ncbi:MAG: DUF4091 domain-containing protein [Anaerolineae bacterium]|nr:DUF4091 domain-containing protein [Anaerolineae bacterium]